MKLNIGIFQYKMRDETPHARIKRLAAHLKKNRACRFNDMP